MSDKRQIAENNKILEYAVGSHLYGTNTPTSDVDYSGVFLPDENMVFGFDTVNEVDLSIKSKKEDGKNDKDAVDRVLYEFRKFVKLALENNPNVLEQLFVKNFKFINGYGQELISQAHLFPYQGLKQKFLGYAFSQKHKMVIRTEKYTELEQANEYIDWIINSKEIQKYKSVKRVDCTEDEKIANGKRLLVELPIEKLSFIVVNGDNLQIGDLNFQKHFMLRKVKKMIDERLSKATNRKNLMTKYGYDTKFGSHLVRLMIEGKELLETGKLEFPLKERQLILDIKQGKYKMSEVIEMAENYEADIENKKSDLPKKPRYDEVQTLTINMLKQFTIFGFDFKQGYPDYV